MPSSQFFLSIYPSRLILVWSFHFLIAFSCKISYLYIPSMQFEISRVMLPWFFSPVWQCRLFMGIVLCFQAKKTVLLSFQNWTRNWRKNITLYWRYVVHVFSHLVLHIYFLNFCLPIFKRVWILKQTEIYRVKIMTSDSMECMINLYLY